MTPDTCRTLAEALLEHAAGEGTATDDVRVAAHLVRCTACRRYHADYRATMALVRRTGTGAVTAPPEALVGAIIAARRRECPRIGP